MSARTIERLRDVLEKIDARLNDCWKCVECGNEIDRELVDELIEVARQIDRDGEA